MFCNQKGTIAYRHEFPATIALMSDGRVKAEGYITKRVALGYHTKNEVIHLHMHLIPMYNVDDENPGRIRSLMPE